MFDKYPAGILQVTVIEARDLHDEDLVGQNDAFVELYLDKDYKQRTSVVDNSNNPVWNETFTFNLEEGRHHKLYLNVIDKDLVGSDDIGEGKLELEEVFNGTPTDTWVKLPAKLGLTSHGEVHLYVQFTPN
ncbi:C2 domain-containing protein [Gilbertella persicaria]|uniref:C2 domain-containing protein n=1 Tax=Gilbertella persicaria TaxID=101096 RepID=UPI00221FFC5A|nr:C2 domain-containing protein [Gilbertella persicaria]KAI8078252.1 C2 domain-containing protein [Gilbertella persicaria]